MLSSFLSNSPSLGGELKELWYHFSVNLVCYRLMPNLWQQFNLQKAIMPSIGQLIQESAVLG